MICKKMNVLRRLAAAILALLVAAPIAARAQGDIYVHAGQNFKPVTIAVPPLLGDDGSVQLSGVIGNDFAHSVFLQPLDPNTFPEKIANPYVRPNIDAWKTINAQLVVTGRVRHAGGRVTAGFDRVIVQLPANRTPNRVGCHIRTIRPINTEVVKESKGDLEEGEVIERDPSIPDEPTQ